VAIIGGGTAASAAAIELGGSGRDTIIIERRDDTGDKIGESLPPSARPFLQALGVAAATDGSDHLQCHGNRSSWGSDRLDDHDFITSPYGHGWHLDRRRFDLQLAARAVESGAQRWTASVVRSYERSGTGWVLTVDRSGATAHITAHHVIDATGRASWFARRQGASRIVGDPMVALACFLRSDRPDPNTFTQVEAVRDGWWYTATLPAGRLAAAFVTDSDLLDRTNARTENGLFELLAATGHTAERIHGYGYRLTLPPTIVDAGDGRLDAPFGDGWLAVGDASMAYDPLSSHGILSALVTGRRGANAVLGAFEADPAAPARYAEESASAFAAYQAERRSYYAAERRWASAPFWMRRHRTAPDR
jgi:flavin-dependent dehydrogenase